MKQVLNNLMNFLIGGKVVRNLSPGVCEEIKPTYINNFHSNASIF